MTMREAKGGEVEGMELKTNLKNDGQTGWGASIMGWLFHWSRKKKIHCALNTLRCVPVCNKKVLQGMHGWAGLVFRPVRVSVCRGLRCGLLASSLAAQGVDRELRRPSCKTARRKNANVSRKKAGKKKKNRVPGLMI
jgi:hypothetical protein